LIFALLVVLLLGCGDDEELMPVTITLRPVSVLVEPQFFGPFPFALLADDNPLTYWSYIHYPSDGYRLGFDTSTLPPGVITAISTVVHRTQEYPPGLISAVAFVHAVHYASGVVPMGTDNMPEVIGVTQVRTLTATGLSIPVGDFTSVGVQEDFSWCCFGLASDLMYIQEMFLLVTVAPAALVEEACVDGVFNFAQQLDGQHATITMNGQDVSSLTLVGAVDQGNLGGAWDTPVALRGEIRECD